MIVIKIDLISDMCSAQQATEFTKMQKRRVSLSLILFSEKTTKREILLLWVYCSKKTSHNMPVSCFFIRSSAFSCSHGLYRSFDQLFGKSSASIIHSSVGRSVGRLPSFTSEDGLHFSGQH